jgi:hypothetical protein
MEAQLALGSGSHSAHDEAVGNFIVHSPQGLSAPSLPSSASKYLNMLMLTRNVAHSLGEMEQMGAMSNDHAHELAQQDARIKSLEDEVRDLYYSEETLTNYYAQKEDCL